MAPRQFALSTETGKSDDSAYSRNDVHNALAKSADTAEMGGHPPRVGRSSVVGLHGSSARLTEIVPSGKQGGLGMYAGANFGWTAEYHVVATASAGACCALGRLCIRLRHCVRRQVVARRRPHCDHHCHARWCASAVPCELQLMFVVFSVDDWA